jgi:hypothetical protein
MSGEAKTALAHLEAAIRQLSEYRTQLVHKYNILKSMCEESRSEEACGVHRQCQWRPDFFGPRRGACTAGNAAFREWHDEDTGAASSLQELLRAERNLNEDRSEEEEEEEGEEELS